MSRAVAEVAAALGVSPDELRTEQPMWLRLMQEGVIVRLHISRWRATTRLAWADLGLSGPDIAEPADRRDTSGGNAAQRASGSESMSPAAEPSLALAELMHLGEKRLLPKKTYDALNNLESSARKALERSAFRTYWGYFLPTGAYADWKKLNDEYAARYTELRDDLVTRYDEIMAELRREYRKAARTAYRRMKLLDPNQMSLKEWSDEAAFVDAFTAGVLANVPGKEEIRESFSFEAELSFVPLPGLLAEETAHQQRVAAERQREALLEQLEQARLVGELSSEQLKARREEEVIRRMADAKLAMQADVLRRAAERKSELVDGFLTSLVGQLRGLVYEVSTDVLASLEKNRDANGEAVLVGKSASQLRNLLEQVERLNIYNDADIEATMDRLRGLLGDAGKRDAGELQTQLRAIATISRATLLGIGERPRSARLLGVEDEPTPAMIRTARRLVLPGAEDDDTPVSARSARRLTDTLMDATKGEYQDAV